MSNLAESNQSMIEHISVVIITRDAAHIIEETLRGLSGFSDIVIYDNGSQDATIDLARQFPNARIIIGEFNGFGPTKREATRHAKNDWVLSLDADEVPSLALIERLKLWPEDSNPHHVGVILRENYFMGKRITRGGWGNDWLVRLFHRNIYNFDDSQVHEKIKLDQYAEKVRIAEPLEHQAITELNQFLSKINQYSDLRSFAPKHNYNPAFIFIKAIFAFLRSYVLRGGWLCGWRGLVIAVADANGVFWKYIKAYVRRKDLE